MHTLFLNVTNNISCYYNLSEPNNVLYACKNNIFETNTNPSSITITNISQSPDFQISLNNLRLPT